MKARTRSGSGARPVGAAWGPTGDNSLPTLLIGTVASAGLGLYVGFAMAASALIVSDATVKTLVSKVLQKLVLRD